MINSQKLKCGETELQRDKIIERFVAYGDEVRVEEFHLKKYSNVVRVEITQGGYETIRNGKIGRINSILLIIKGGLIE